MSVPFTKLANDKPPIGLSARSFTVHHRTRADLRAAT